MTSPIDHLDGVWIQGMVDNFLGVLASIEDQLQGINGNLSSIKECVEDVANQLEGIKYKK